LKDLERKSLLYYQINMWNSIGRSL